MAISPDKAYLITKNLLISKANEEDIPKVINLNRIALPENYSPDFFDEIFRRYGELFYVAKLNGDVVGYVMCRTEFPSIAHVISLAVHPNYRRLGVATRLMMEVHKAMARIGLRKSYLEVRVTNQPAINLYEKLGYRKTRVIPSYYMDGTDGFLMELNLEGWKV
jgi:ribosomal-protein-alanine N-acetyltransferase